MTHLSLRKKALFSAFTLLAALAVSVTGASVSRAAPAHPRVMTTTFCDTPTWATIYSGGNIGYPDGAIERLKMLELINGQGSNVGDPCDAFGPGTVFVKVQNFDVWDAGGCVTFTADLYFDTTNEGQEGTQQRCTGQQGFQQTGEIAIFCDTASYFATGRVYRNGGYHDVLQVQKVAPCGQIQ